MKKQWILMRNIRLNVQEIVLFHPKNGILPRSSRGLRIVGYSKSGVKLDENEPLK